MITKKIAKELDAIGDWVIIEKCEDLDWTKKVGNIIIPDSVNIKTRESKIGKIISVGKGTTDNKGRFNKNTVEAGRYCYYTRFGQQIIESDDSQRYIIVRDRGVLAYIDFWDRDTGKVKTVTPRYDNLYVESIPVESDKTNGGIIIPNPDPELGEYQRYLIYAVGDGQPTKTKKEIDHNKRIPVEAKVGQVAWATEHCGVQISHISEKDRRLFRLIPEHQCIMIEPVS